MKRIFLIIMLLSIFIGTASAALTYDENYFLNNISNMLSQSTTDNPLYLFMNESIGYLEGTTALTKLYLDPQSTAPTSPSEGTLYYRDSGDALVLYTPAGWVTLDTAGASSLDTSYGVGGSVTVDAGAIVFTATNAADTPAFGVIQLDTGSVVAQTIASSGTGALLAFTSGGTGNDCLGTGSTWSITKAGVITVTGIILGGTDLVMENADTFNNVDDDVFEFDSNDKEDFEIDLSGTDIVKFTSDTSAVTLEFDSLDRLTGIETIDFDAEAGDLTLTADLGGEDFTVQQAGSVDASLVLYSAGTGVDAVKMYAAKGIDIDAVDDLNIRNTATTDADDFHIRQEGESDASLIISSDGTGTDALALLTDDSSGSGDIDVTSGDDIDINAADNITVDTSGGSITATAAGTTLGDITLSVADDYSNTVAGKYSLTVTGSSAISATGSVTVTSTANGPLSIYIRENAGTAGAIKIYADKGAGANSIELDSDVGGINIHADAGDMTLTAGDDLTTTVAGKHALTVTGSSNYTVTGSLVITATGNGIQTIYVRENAGTAGAIKIHADQGTGSNSIELDSDVGAINVHADAGALTLTAAGTTAGDVTLSVADDYGNTVGGKHALTVTGSSTVTVTGSLVITGKSNGIQSIYIRENAGSAGAIKIHADQGTGSSSIELDSDGGAIFAHADAGAITLTATGVSAGDMTLTVGDDYANTVTGDYVLAVTGTTTLPDIRFKREVYVSTASVTYINAASTGVCYVTTASTVSAQFVLPTAAAGLTFTFVDVSATAGDDLQIIAAASDTINGGGAAESYQHTADTVPGSVTLMAVDATQWVVTSIVGTWGNND